MKDMYSFHATQEDFERFYGIAKTAYMKIYKRLGLVAKVTEASGGGFSEKISYEFMVLTDAGEDDIFYCDKCEYCVNAGIAKGKAGDKCSKCGKGTLSAGRASEVGNVFDLGQKYGRDFNLAFTDKDGTKKYPVMGCYGIGISRLMGVIVEKNHDERGIIWPESVSPFRFHLIELKRELGKEIYRRLSAKSDEVLYDDRDASAGEKFADADLLGIPYRLIVSEKTRGKIEIKKRNSKNSKLISYATISKLL
jgi:prolyl-tRNA synthetase